MKAVLSVVIWIVSVFLTILLFFVVSFLVILLFPFDKKRMIAHRQCFWWADAIVRLNPYWHLEIKGVENIDYRRPYVIVANHQSLADIVVLYKTKIIMTIVVNNMIIFQLI